MFEVNPDGSSGCTPIDLDVALSGSGERLVVGATDEDSQASGIGGDQADNSATGAGAACVY